MIDIHPIVILIFGAVMHFTGYQLGKAAGRDEERKAV